MKYKATYKPSRSSLTVPNQSLTVKEILERFTRGQSLPLNRVSHDDPQNLSEDDQMQLHECEDDFERRQILLDIEEGELFNSRQSEASEAKRSEAKSASRRREENNNPNEKSKDFEESKEVTE